MEKFLYHCTMPSAAQKEELHRLVNVFLQENATLNLSAFRTQEMCWVGNVLDSLAVFDFFAQCPKQKTKSLLDLGTGGGFPLLPLAICLPDTQFVGLDATQKKVNAVQRIADTLELRNVRLICGRAEELGRDARHRACYDAVTVRAVAPLNVLIEYAVPFLKIGGHLIVWKSMSIKQELADSLLARAELSCHLVHTHRYELPEGFGKRQLLVFEKTAKTPEKYPRGVGVAKKKPLQ